MAYKGLSGGGAGGAGVGSLGVSSGGSGSLLGKIVKAPFQFAGNLATDIGDAAIGLVPGLVQLAKDPVDTSKQIGESIADTWAPLFTGHPGEFAEEFFNHPLGPILDVAAVFTLGAGGAARAARGVSTAHYSTRGATAVGQRAITRKASVPGGFEKVIDNPNPIDRLAAYSREGSKTLYAKDVPGRVGRRDDHWGTTPRADIPFQTPNTVAGKFRAEMFHGLAETLATRGGRYGRLTTMPYEMRYRTRLAGNIGSMAFLMGQLHSRLDLLYNDTDKFSRIQNLRSFAKTYHEGVQAHALETGRVVSWDGPASAWQQQVYNKQAYNLLGKPGKMTKRRAYTDPETGEIKSRPFGGDTVDDVIHDVGQWGKMIATKRDPMVITGDKAKRLGLDPNKKHMFLVDKYSQRNRGVDAQRSLGALHKLFQRGTSMWKTILLGYSPRFFVNNTVGNNLLYLIHEAGPGAVFGYHQAIKQIRKEKAHADVDLAQALREIHADSIVNKYFSDQASQSLHHSLFYDAIKPDAVKGTALERPGFKPQGRLERGGSHIFGATGKLSERLLRYAVIMRELYAHPKVKERVVELQKRNPGMRREDVFYRAADDVLGQNVDIRRYIRQQVENVMGNYTMLSGPERVLRDISPFYTWQRHIVRNSFSLAKDKSVRTALLARLGEHGSAQLQGMLGENAPEWMRSFIPFSAFDKVPGGREDSGMRIPFLNTQGLNPYAQVGELAQAAESLMPGGTDFRVGETVGSLLNPYLQAGAEELGGTSLLTGEPVSATPHNTFEQLERGVGPLGRIFGGPFFSLPHVTAAQTLVDPGQYDDPTLYEKSPRESLLALLGVPVKWVYQPRVDQLGKAEQSRRR